MLLLPSARLCLQLLDVSPLPGALRLVADAVAAHHGQLLVQLFHLLPQRGLHGPRGVQLPQLEAESVDVHHAYSPHFVHAGEQLVAHPLKVLVLLDELQVLWGGVEAVRVVVQRWLLAKMLLLRLELMLWHRNECHGTGPSQARAAGQVNCCCGRQGRSRETKTLVLGYGILAMAILASNS